MDFLATVSEERFLVAGPRFELAKVWKKLYVVTAP
jgi:hypothetical protein